VKGGTGVMIRILTIPNVPVNPGRGDLRTLRGNHPMQGAPSRRLVTRGGCLFRGREFYYLEAVHSLH
jgi:hypothetical protein